jgi:hypothetical protein
MWQMNVWTTNHWTLTEDRDRETRTINLRIQHDPSWNVNRE